MFNDNEDIHDKRVISWESESINGLKDDDLVELYTFALTRIEKRAHKTLSAVTLMVVFDRIIHQNKAIYPALSEVKINEDPASFFLILSPTNLYSTKQTVAALRCMLIEVLKVLGRITANILTDALHKELATVNWEETKKAKRMSNSPEDK